MSNNTSKDLLFLWIFRWGNQLKSNKNLKTKQFDWSILQDDCYFRYIKELLKKGFINNAHVCCFDAKLKEESKEIYPNIFIHIFRSFESCLEKLKGHYKLLIVRGNFNEYNLILDNITRDATIFYIGYREFLPTCIPIEKLDILWVDSRKQAKIGKNKYPQKKWVILEKTANTEIFYGDDGIEKKYDICYPAHFAPFKNHELLFASIGRMKDGEKITCICPGKFKPEFSNSEIGLWAKMHDVNIFLPGLLSFPELAKIMRQSKIGVVPSEKEGNPRIIAEMLACGLPIVANKNLTSGLRHINSKTGIKSSLDNFPKNLSKLLKKYKNYHSEKYFMKFLSTEKVVKQCLIDPVLEIINQNKIKP